MTAEEAEIKSAYRKLARKYHPDVAGNNEETIKKFKEITEAYEILTDREKRKNYDTIRGFYTYAQAGSAYKNPYGQQRKQTHEEKKETSQQSTQKKQSKEKTQKQSENKTKNNTESFTKAWENFVGGLNKEKETKAKEEKIFTKNGSDINTEITISISEAINGTQKTLNILHTEPCPKCNGRPFINGGKCSVCDGKGELSTHKKIVVKIPAMVKNGSKIRLSNEGNLGINGGENGDLYITVKIENNEEIKYDGLNVLKTIPITPQEAVLGGEIDIPVSTGTVTMKIMPNTSNGQKYRLAGEGVQKNGKTGDMIITIIIDIPKNLTEEEIELYKKLKAISKRNIRDSVYE